jgi:mono/diheme cytochrome c family protein
MTGLLSSTLLAVSPALLQTLGRMHVIIVHFPIALLLVAGAAELWRSLRKSKQPSPTAIACLVIGGLTAVASAALGWIHKGFTGFAAEGGRTLALHQWIGIAAAAASVIALIALAISGKGKRSLWPYRTATILCAILVAAAGHFGGTLTHGDGYLTELLFPAQPTSAADTTSSATPAAPQELAPMPVAFPSDGKVTFARDVQPIIQQTCLDCHGPAKHRANLRLDTKADAIKGGANGPALVAGKADNSLIIKHVLALDGKKRMPMGHEPLTDAQIKILRAWIDGGADWPASSTIAIGEQKQHWAYVKPTHPDPPKVSDPAWCRNAIDHFVMARLDKEGMKPSPEADRTTLIRRLSLDLLGLPPTPEEVDAFVADPDPNVYEKVVSRMLSSPHYGERWGRHWLDIARYADTNGYEKDNVRTIWPYRDWVINAINRDMPFDQFVVDQVAGDMLPGATDEEKIATGFHRNTMFNEEGGIDAEEFRFKAIVDRVQTTSTALLGLTMQCAQCHNHKYDDISQKEYYQFFSLLNNADEPDMAIRDAAITEQRRQTTERIDKLTRELPKKFPARDESIKWEVISPDVFATSHATTRPSRLVLQKDNSLLATGPKHETDTYIIEADVNVDGVTAFRLETLTDPSLPHHGPGRIGGKEKNGNFVLSQFKVEQADTEGGKPTRVKIDRAEAEYSQPNFEVVKSIDDYFTNGWGIGGRPDFNRNVSATFYTPDKLTGTKRLTITLLQQFKDHTLGKFRLSVGRVPPPPATQPTEQDRQKFMGQQLDAWEQSIKAKSAHWTVLAPTKFSRLHDATITKMDDNSLLFTGDNFYREQYNLQYATKLKDIAAIRLELLTHPDLPKSGPGRDPGGGYVLSEFTGVASSQLHPPSTQPAVASTQTATTQPGAIAAASTQPAAPATQPINIASATADIGADSIDRAFDGKKDTHWTVLATGGGSAHEAVFKLKDKIAGYDGGTLLDLSLVQNYFQSENLGRVRISVTTDANAVEATGLPADVEAIVMTPKENRTPEQTARLREHFLSVTPLLAAQHAEIADARASMPQYTTTLVMKERAIPRDTRIHHRGEYLQPTDPVDGAVPSVLPPLPKDAPRNRLTLARWLVSTDNPLVGRVVMNRVWTQYFGRGIVNTVEDFGVMGERPSHPELLDWLATEFARQNWSMKAMHRLIVTSATYRQSSRLTPDLEKKDPQNVWLARGPRFRVEGEIVRDIALTSSGLLNGKVGGPSVFPPQPPGISELSYGPLKWVESVGPDKYRRGMYTFLKRTAMYPAMTTFDGPTAEVVCARRMKSNTPLQALTTLNDTVFMEAAQAMARRVIEAGPKDDTSRATEVFRLCIARKPDEVELKTVVDFYQSQLKRFQDDKKLNTSAIALADPNEKSANATMPELAAWTTVARSILNLDETVTKE